MITIMDTGNWYWSIVPLQNCFILPAPLALDPLLLQSVNPISHSILQTDDRWRMTDDHWSSNSFNLSTNTIIAYWHWHWHWHWRWHCAPRSTHNHGRRIALSYTAAVQRRNRALSNSKKGCGKVREGSSSWVSIGRPINSATFCAWWIMCLRTPTEPWRC